MSEHLLIITPDVKPLLMELVDCLDGGKHYLWFKRDVNTFLSNRIVNQHMCAWPQLRFRSAEDMVEFKLRFMCQ